MNDLRASEVNVNNLIVNPGQTNDLAYTNFGLKRIREVKRG